MSDATTAEGAAAVEAAPAKKPAMGMLIGVIAGGVLAGAGAGVFVVAPKLSPAPADVATAKAAEAKKAAEKEAAPGKIVTFENIVVNPAGSDGGRFVMATIAIEVPTDEDEKKLKAGEIRIRDDITTLIASFTSEQLSAPDARVIVKARLAELLKGELGEVKPKIYLPQFVIQ